MTTPSTLKFSVSLFIQAPYFSASQASQQFGVDNAILRDSQGVPAIAGSSLRGLLRHAWEELNQYGLGVDINTWLGDAYKGKESDSRSKMRFSHWYTLASPSDLASSSSRDQVRYRIELESSDSEKEGTVKRGSLQVIEAPFNTGETLVFKGEISVNLASYSPAERTTFKQHLLHCLSKGLNWIPCVGGLNGIGFGKLCKAEIKECEEEQNASPLALKCLDEDLCGIELRFDRPVCFAKPQKGKSEGNLFEASDTIPGAAIIAVIARHIGYKNNKIVDNLRVTHAFPCTDKKESKSQRPIPIPYSWAYIKNDHLKDEPELLKDLAHISSDRLDGMPTFLLDWKSEQFTEAVKATGWPEINKLEETRTAISEKRAATPSQLFTMQMVDNNALVWRANIDFSDIPNEDKTILKQKLKEILTEPLAPFGKTDAQATVTLHPAFSYSHPSESIDTALKQEGVTLTLATDAQLFDAIPSTDQAESVDTWRQCYQAIFDRLSPNTFQIKQQFCREKLVGGNYIRKRFDNPEGNYTPRLLTEAGSVFVLKVLDKDKARTTLEKWLRTGIPLLKGNSDWRISPYRNFNGYGEVMLNLQQPKQGGQK